MFPAVPLYVLFNGLKLYRWNFLFGIGVTLSSLTMKILPDRKLEIFKEKCQIDY